MAMPLKLTVYKGPDQVGEHEANQLLGSHRADGLAFQDL